MTTVESNHPDFERLVGAEPVVELMATGFAFTEGPVWRGDHLLFSDIPSNRIIRFEMLEEGPAVTTFRYPSGNSNGQTLDSQGRLMDQDRDGNAGELEDDQFTLVFRQQPPAPEISVIDNGDAGYSSVGGWTTYVGVGAQGDFAYIGVGTGSGSADWTVTGLTAGQYRVSATWESYTNRAIDATYTRRR